MSKFFLMTLAAIFSASLSSAQSISNFEEIRANLGLSPLLDRVRSGRTVKVAILDKAFKGLNKAIGRTLPKKTRYIKGVVENGEDTTSDHGVRMAEIVTALVTNDLRSPSRLDLRLYNVYGFTNFRDAITDLIAQKVDLVLYSEVWEFGGNLDGRGFINAEVDRALDAGILWVNAAGNFARGSYTSAIEIGDESWVKLPDQNQSLKIVCKAEGDKKCPLRIVLSWNDFKNDPEAGTDKDLDMALTDDMLNVIQTSTLKQSSDRKESRDGYSKYPREIIGANVKAGTYFVRVKAASDNFNDDDRLRITVDGDGFQVPSTQPDESLLVPADNPRVLTVGAIDSDRSGRSVRLGKPDLLTISSVKLSDDNEFRGSSNSAAFTAAVAALLNLSGERVSRSWFLKHGRAFNWERGQLSLRQLGFGPQQSNCFVEGEWKTAPGYIRNAMMSGAKLVQTTAGWRLMTPFDPIVLFPDLQRSSASDMIVISEGGAFVYSRGDSIPIGAVEVFGRPQEAGLCTSPSVKSGRILAF